ncbi:MAG TPA: hypothetical protein VFB12_17540 [Ktedonobacteraceae bacterium]|nr:hypothetical protein [Ktedonobacteraceae bacterium]
MASSTFATENPIASQEQRTFIGGLGFDRVMMVLSFLFVGGVYLDGWAHSHGLVDKTFFTPWHAVLYSAYAANAVLLVAVTLMNHRRGRSWSEAVPEGYKISLYGVPLFLIGGVGDLIWHTLFGFETGIAPLLSPTHLVLATSAILIMSGPLQAIWRRAENGETSRWATLFPALLSLLSVFSMLTFFTSFASPITHIQLLTNPYTEVYGSWGAAGVLLQATMLMGMLLLMLRRWQLPLGSMTMLFTLNAALMDLFNKQYLLAPVVAAAVAGVICDLLFWRLQPSVKRSGAFRLFAFVVPIIYYLSYFASVELTSSGITWTIHLWLGVTVMSGFASLLMSYLLVPPAFPEAARS